MKKFFVIIMLLAGAVGCRRGADSRADSAANSMAGRVVTASEEPREIIGGDTLLAEPLKWLPELAPEELLQSVGSNGSEYLFLEVRDWETGEIPTEFIKNKLYSIRLSYRPGLEAGDKPLYKYLFGKIKFAADYPYFGPAEKIDQLSAVASPSDTIIEYRCVYVRSEILEEKPIAEPSPAVLIKTNVVTGEVIELRDKDKVKWRGVFNDDTHLLKFKYYEERYNSSLHGNDMCHRSDSITPLSELVTHSSAGNSAIEKSLGDAKLKDCVGDRVGQLGTDKLHEVQRPIPDESASYLIVVDSIVEKNLSDGLLKEYVGDRVGQLTVEIMNIDEENLESDRMLSTSTYLITVQTGYAPNRKQRYVYQGAHRAYLSANNIVSFKELPANAKVDAADNSRYVVQWSFFFRRDKKMSATLTVAEKTGFQRTVRFKNLLSK